jgi:hypothetical protein
VLVFGNPPPLQWPKKLICDLLKFLSMEHFSQ